MAKTVKMPARMDYPAQDIMELGMYVIQSTGIAATDDTGESIAFNVKANTLIMGIGWRTVGDWVNDSGDMTWPVITLGSTDDYDRYATFTAAHLGDTDQGGMLWPFYESTADAKIAFYVETQGDASTGSMEMWLVYRPFSDRQRYIERRAGG